MAAIDSPSHSKSEAVFESNENGTELLDTEFKEEVGGLKFDQYLAGGLGRHLGLFSTTSLMWEFSTTSRDYATANDVISVSGELSALESSPPLPRLSMASDLWVPRCSYGCWGFCCLCRDSAFGLSLPA